MVCYLYCGFQAFFFLKWLDALRVTMTHQLLIDASLTHSHMFLDSMVALLPDAVRNESTLLKINLHITEIIFIKDYLCNS